MWTWTFYVLSLCHAQKTLLDWHHLSIQLCKMNFIDFPFEAFIGVFCQPLTNSRLQGFRLCRLFPPVAPGKRQTYISCFILWLLASGWHSDHISTMDLSWPSASPGTWIISLISAILASSIFDSWWIGFIQIQTFRPSSRRRHSRHSSLWYSSKVTAITVRSPGLQLLVEELALVVWACQLICQRSAFHSSIISIFPSKTHNLAYPLHLVIGRICSYALTFWIQCNLCCSIKNYRITLT